jgi:DNA-binding NtrC family response regulator
LLKVLEDKKFRRLGEVQDRKVDIRLIAATHRDLAALIGSGGFREDLYFRISTISLRVPRCASGPKTYRYWLRSCCCALPARWLDLSCR